MTVTLFLSSPQFPLFSTSSSVSLVILKNPKPLHSLSSNATSFFLQNQCFPLTNNKDKHKQNSNENEGDVEANTDSSKIKMPTAPWMKGPLLLEPDQVLNLSKPTPKKRTEPHKVDRSLTEKVSGRRGNKAMKKIVQSIEKLHLVDTQKNWDDTQIKRCDFEGGFLMGKLEVEDSHGGVSKFGQKMPWEREEKVVFRRLKREKVESAAELSLDKDLLMRLRGEASKMRKWVKVKKAGVTQAVIDEVHSLWANNELVMFKFDMPLCRNMDRAREIVEAFPRNFQFFGCLN